MRQGGMDRIPLGPSRREIWSNERAFPGQAVNTIAFALTLPETTAAELSRALDRVEEAARDLLSLTLSEGPGGPWLTPGPGLLREGADLCSQGEAEARWEAAAAERLPAGRLTHAVTYPLSEGGVLLSLRFHHVLVDGYSMCQIAQLVLSALEGKALPSLPPAPETEETAEAAEADRAFWRSCFAGLSHESALFLEEGQGLRRRVDRYPLSPDLSRRIDQAAARMGVTPASVFAGALGLYLARSTQRPDAVFLMPRLNRDTPALRSQGGCRTMAVPVRLPAGEAADFAGLCRLARTQAAAASAHKGYGLTRLLGELRQAGLAEEGLSQYTLNFYQPRLHASLPFSIRLSMDGAMHNHLTLNITRLQGPYELAYDSREGVYTPERTAAFHEALLAILEQGLAGKKPLEEFSIVGRREGEALLALRGESAPISHTDTIPGLFSRAARQYAGRPALYAGETAYTFQELDRLSNRVANALLRRGAGRGEPVLFLLPRDRRLVPVLLGILKAGAAFVPVDPAYPKSRVDYILENSGASVLISVPEVSGGRPFTDADDLLRWPEEGDPAVAIPQEQTAYCIYTSGTTGRPKGVMLSHRGIVNITRPDNNPFNRDLCRNGRGLVMVGSICFDISLFELFVPLLNGLFVELAPEDALADPGKLARLIRAHGANLLHCTPSRLSAYLREPEFAAALREVEAVLSAGEVLPGSLADTLRRDYGLRIYNGYGPTETTIGATITEAGDNRTIGRPIGNAGVLILDRAGRLLPWGAEGELWVWGDGVGIGYLGLPEQTAERFVTRLGRRMYRTGDLGRLLPDGRILYRGRNDQQVKLRGLRIELSEIENQMRAFPGVREARAAVRTLAGSQHLVGFYTAGRGERVSPEALAAHLKEHLAYYMVPDILKELPAMPQTPGGKVDDKALAREPVAYVRVYRAPETPLQEKLCAAFSAVLQEERIGLDDNFFSLGGDSLHIAELVSEIEERCPEASLAFEDVFRCPTPALLERHLTRRAAGEPDRRDNLLPALDYRGLDRVLSPNRSGPPARRPLGTVLLTGVTGFLGIHVLLELLRQPAAWDNILCLVRPTRRLSGEQRLKGVLFYYGEADGAGLLGKRLFPVEGDLETDLSAALGDRPVDTVLNCAASVAHFAYDDKLRRSNVEGVRRLLAFCRSRGAALAQVSTISVAGVSPSQSPPRTLTEEKLWMGQEIHNQYILSKYLAEYELLRSAAREGTAVRILRVGNLQGRLADGEFQMNSRTNAFVRRLASYVKLGLAPRSLFEGTVNFSPVDEVARVMTALLQLEGPRSVFHVYPPEEIPWRTLFAALGDMGRPVEPAEDRDFAALVERQAKTREGKALLEGLLLERGDLRYRENPVDASLTAGTLRAMGVGWNPITRDYLDRCLGVLEDYFMFEESL